MKNKSYIGISFIVLIFGIWAIPKIIAKLQKSDLVEIGPVPTLMFVGAELELKIKGPTGDKIPNDG